MKNYSNKRAFTLVEILVVITIIITISTIGIVAFNIQWANDTKRVKTVSDVKTYIEDFKQKYGAYPNSNSTGRRYPSSGCSVTGYDSLMSCLVATEVLVEDSETYNWVAFDPTEGEYNEFDKEYAYYYGTENKWNKFKICALMGKQTNEIDHKGLDGNDAQKGSRYYCITSDNTKLTDVTSMNK